MKKQNVFLIFLFFTHTIFSKTSLELTQELCKTNYTEISFLNWLKTIGKTLLVPPATFIIVRAFTNILQAKPREIDFFNRKSWTIGEKIIVPTVTLYSFKKLLDRCKPEFVASQANHALLNFLCDQSTITNTTIEELLASHCALNQFPRTEAFILLTKLHEDLTYIKSTHSVMQIPTLVKALTEDLARIVKALGLLKQDPLWLSEYKIKVLENMQRVQEADYNSRIAGSFIHYSR